MGIAGQVRCTCYEDGSATPPPVPVRVDEHGDIQPVESALRDAVWTWMRTACRHEGMNLAEFGLGWSHVRSFRAALEAAGAERFPVLLASLPEWNYSIRLTPAEAATALGELDRFAAAVRPITVDRVVTADGRDTWCETPRGHADWCYTCPPGVAGLTGRGTFAVWPGTDLGLAPLFEAARFAQRVLERDADGRVRLVELTDLDTGRTHRVVHALSLDEEEPDRFEVRSVAVAVDDSYAAVPRLRAVLEGSVATGHPAEWG